MLSHAALNLQFTLLLFLALLLLKYKLQSPHLFQKKEKKKRKSAKLSTIQQTP